MNQGQPPPWHASRQHLARVLQTLQSENKPIHQNEIKAPQQHENVAQQVQSRIAAVRNALLAAPVRLAQLDGASKCTDGSAATPRSTSTEAIHLHASANALSDAGGGSFERAAAAVAAQSVYSDAIAAHNQLDFAAALPLFKLAGEAGHSASCAYLALYFIEGRAVERNSQQAWKWACRGAEMNDADSMGLKAR